MENNNLNDIKEREEKIKEQKAVKAQFLRRLRIACFIIVLVWFSISFFEGFQGRRYSVLRTIETICCICAAVIIFIAFYSYRKK